ncbi:hypothetical protein ACFSQT_16120 [Mesorhizobium calcicola]|uniref:GGDEF domain-containing protein n=1 Tax=Mesorhizobium calcicola TaxID=1300310 RepID=A0ABW4WEC6_9HYPH
MGKPVAACGQSLRLGASIGIAFADAVAPCDLFMRADTALYAAKAARAQHVPDIQAGGRRERPQCAA